MSSNRFYTRYVYPMMFRLRGEDVILRLREMERSQWYPPEKVQQLQLNKLRQLLNKTYTENLFYRNRFEKERVHPSDLRSLSDLGKFPFLEKADFVEPLTKQRVFAEHARAASKLPSSPCREFTLFRLVRNL